MVVMEVVGAVVWLPCFSKYLSAPGSRGRKGKPYNCCHDSYPKPMILQVEVEDRREKMQVTVLDSWVAGEGERGRMWWHEM